MKYTLEYDEELKGYHINLDGNHLGNIDVKNILNEQADRIAEIEADKIELIAEFAEASCMGDLGKIARNHGYDQQAGDL